MANKFLYNSFLKDKRIYNLNQGYWKRVFKKKLNEELMMDNILFMNVDKEGSKIYDANPIFTYINQERTRAVRIIQDDTSLATRNCENGDFFISAWIDSITLYDKAGDNNEGTAVEELVIALYLTRETVDTSMKLVTRWLSFDLNEDAISQILDVRA